MSQPVMDQDAFDQMRTLMGDSYRDVIDLCLQTFPTQNRQIQQAIEQGDAEAIFNAAHRLKSACGSVGALGLADRAQHVEQIAKSGETDIPDEAISALSAAVDEATEFLQQAIRD